MILYHFTAMENVEAIQRDRGRSFMLYFQIMVLESFASIIGALLTMPAATMLRSKNAKPTIIMME